MRIDFAAEALAVEWADADVKENPKLLDPFFLLDYAIRLAINTKYTEATPSGQATRVKNREEGRTVSAILKVLTRAGNVRNKAPGGPTELEMDRAGVKFLRDVIKEWAPHPAWLEYRDVLADYLDRAVEQDEKAEREAVKAKAESHENGREPEAAGKKARK